MASGSGVSAGTVEYRTGAKRREDMPRKPGTVSRGNELRSPRGKTHKPTKTAPPQAAQQVPVGGRQLRLQLISDAPDPSICHEIGWHCPFREAGPVLDDQVVGEVASLSRFRSGIQTNG